MKSIHLTLTAVLVAGLALTAYIGLTGSFQLFNAKGLLSGPFSALILLGAAQGAGLLLVLLDWRVWQPQAAARAQDYERWLNCELLGNTAPPPHGWEKLSGQFRSRAVAIQRGKTERERRGVGVWRWSVPTQFGGSFAIVRTVNPLEVLPGAAVAPANELSSGDAEFEARYAWQADRPSDLAALLRREDVRSALKRLSSLFSLHGALSDPLCGVRVADQAVVLSQVPAPSLERPTFNPDELLLILHDLTLVAAALEGSALPEATAPVAEAAPEPGGAWLALGCGFVVALLLWLALTYLVNRFVGLPAAMAAFFLPAVALALWFIIISARGSGRDAEIDATIDREALAVTARTDLAKLKYANVRSQEQLPPDNGSTNQGSGATG